MRLVSAEEYTRLERPSLSWLIEGHIPSPSLTVLLGEPKAGKSFLALQLAYAVARGEKALGANTHQGNVLYFQFDTSELVWRDRFQKLSLHGENISGPLYMIHPEDNPPSCNIMEPPMQRFIKDAILQAKPSLIVFDVLRELHNRKEESSTDMKVVGDTIMELTQGYAVLLIHHTSKISNKETVRVIDLARGSSYLAGKADAVWCIIDNTLHMIPRFAEQRIVEGRRKVSGYWEFPLLESSDRLNALCDQYPGLDHRKIVEKVARGLGLRPSTVRGFLDGRPCVHS